MPRDGPTQQALRDAVDKAIYSKIFDTSFTIDMPKLGPDLWDQVSVELGGDENERLEFLGDKLMDACIGIELYKTVPDGDPHKYTVCSPPDTAQNLSRLVCILDHVRRPALQPHFLACGSQDGSHESCRYEDHRRRIRNHRWGILHGERLRRSADLGPPTLRALGASC